MRVSRVGQLYYRQNLQRAFRGRATARLLTLRPTKRPLPAGRGSFVCAAAIGASTKFLARETLRIKQCNRRHRSSTGAQFLICVNRHRSGRWLRKSWLPDHQPYRRALDENIASSFTQASRHVFLGQELLQALKSCDVREVAEVRACRSVNLHLFNIRFGDRACALWQIRCICETL